MPPQLAVLFDPRRRSLVRGTVLVILSFVVSVKLSDFPHNHATLALILPALLACAGTADTMRCMQRQWNFYHAGVMLCIYMDLMAVCMIFFFLIYPYTRFIATSN